jgi:predicted Zn-dependent protease with MMP-like domain
LAILVFNENAQAGLFWKMRSPRLRRSGVLPGVDWNNMNARHWRKLVTMAEEETRGTLAGLPPELRERASGVPVMMEPWVSDELMDTGLEPDILGLFVGDSFNITQSNAPMPPQIFLFLESIWASVEGNEADFREEVQTTYLHELGHYLGLDEDDLEDRGLE